MAFKKQILVLIFLLGSSIDLVHSDCAFLESPRIFTVRDDAGPEFLVATFEVDNPDEVNSIERVPTSPYFDFKLNPANQVELITTAQFDNLDTIISTPTPTISLNGLTLDCGATINLITVNLEDTNNRSPEFISGMGENYEIKLPASNFPVNWQGPIIVTDKDYDPANNQLTFSFSSSDPNTRFETSEFTQRVLNGVRLDYYQLYFRVSSGSSSPGLKTVEITADDGVTAPVGITVTVNITAADDVDLPPSLEYDDNYYEAEIDLSQSNPIPIATISDDKTAPDDLGVTLDFDDSTFEPFVNDVRIGDKVSLTISTDIDLAIVRRNNYLLKFTMIVRDSASNTSQRRFVLRFKKIPVEFVPPVYDPYYLKEETSEVILVVSASPNDPNMVLNISSKGSNYLTINQAGEIKSLRTQDEIDENSGKADIFTVTASLDGETATTMIVIVNVSEDQETTLGPPPSTTDSSPNPSSSTDSDGGTTDFGGSSVDTSTTDANTISSGSTDTSDDSTASVTDMSTTTSNFTETTNDPSSSPTDTTGSVTDMSTTTSNFTETTNDPSYSPTDTTGSVTDMSTTTSNFTETTNDPSSSPTDTTGSVTGISTPTTVTLTDSTPSVTGSDTTTSATSPTSTGGTSPGTESTTSTSISSTTGLPCPPCPPDSCSTTSIAPSTSSSSAPTTTTSSGLSTCRPCEDVSTCPPCSCGTTVPPDDVEPCQEDCDCDNSGYIAGICVMSAVTVGCIVATAFVVWKYVWLPQRSVYTPFRADLETGLEDGKPRANSMIKTGTMNSTGLEKASSMKNINGSLRSGPRGSFVSTGTSNGFVRQLDDDGGAFNSDPDVKTDAETAQNFGNGSSVGQPKEVYDIPYEQPTQRSVIPELAGTDVYDSIAPLTSPTASEASAFSPSSARGIDSGAIYDTVGSVDGEQAKEPKADYEGVKFDDEVKVIEHEPPPEMEGDDEEIEDEGNGDGNDSEDDDDDDSDEDSVEERGNGEDENTNTNF